MNNKTKLNKGEVIKEIKQRRFERRTSTGSDAFSLFKCLYVHKGNLPDNLEKPLPKTAKSSLLSDLRRSKSPRFAAPWIGPDESPFACPHFLGNITTDLLINNTSGDGIDRG